MNTNNFLYATCIFFITFMLVSCQTVASPEVVSEKFWQAVQRQNIDQIKKHSVEGSIPDDIDVNKLGNIAEYSFGKILIDGEKAEVETIVVVNKTNKQNILSLSTKLLMQDKKWKVDFNDTVSPLMINNEVAELMGGIEELTEEFAKEVEGSVKEFKEKAMPEIKLKLEEAERELKEKLPEIKEKIDEFLKDLEESIQDAFPKQKDEKQPVET